MKDSPVTIFNNLRSRKCPCETESVAFFEKRLNEGDHARVGVHVASCKNCLEQLAFLINVTESALPEVPLQLLRRTRQQALATPEKRFSNRTLAFGIAACLAAVVGISLMQKPSPSNLPPIATQDTDKTATDPVAKGIIASTRPEPPGRAPRRYSRGGDVSNPALSLIDPKPNAILKAGGIEFRWRPLPGALHYEVTVAAADGSLIWQSEESESQARMPSSIALAKSSTYFVWVRALFADGKSVASKPVPFAVQP
jgi:hypothetical protein